MRKITLLMGLLLSFLGVAQVSAQDYRYSGSPISSTSELTSGRYLISVYSKGKEGLLYWSNTLDDTRFSVSATSASSKTSSPMTASGEDAKYMWDIVVDGEGKFTIQSVSSSNYTSKMGAQGEGKHNVLYVSAGNANIGKHQLETLVTISGIPHFTVKLANGVFIDDGADTYFHCNGEGRGTTKDHMHLSYWKGVTTSQDNNSSVKMAFYRMDPDLGTSTITYDYQINGVSMKTEQHIVANGAAFPNLTLPPAFCTGTKPEGTVSAEDDGKTKVINVTWNGPFNYSSTVGDAKWYLMTLAKAPNGNLPVVRYNPEHQYITLEQGDNTFTYAKNDQWAFVGNPFDGFKIYNRALSGGRLISTTTMSTGEGRTTRPYVSADELPSGYTDTWDIHLQEWNRQNQTEITGGFAISQHGTPANKMNRRAQTENNGNQSDFCMAYWTGGSDNGSTFTVRQTNLPNITLNTPDNGTTSYASFFVDYPVVVTTDNVKVYTGTVNNNSLEMTEAGDKIIPANVGVVLISETGANTAEISISDGAGTLESSDLTGTTTARNIDGSQSNYLVLGRDKDDLTKVGFYRPSGTQIPANKAYIYLAGGNVQGLAFNFDGATTDINSVSATTDKQEIYDLSGRRVMKANKGLYIINGKKCFIK
ncbi:MAG: hypothetical protein PUH44_07725 [Bacteroidales bacterium]|nr:hypothetical protein [Bacteroidales bacterium]MDY2704555.1 hypothetical protein [Alloprevotella sp.]